MRHTYLSYLLSIAMTVALSPSLSTAQQPGGTVSGEDHTVSGLLEQLDLTNRKGLLRTPLGKPIFFEITKPELFAGISIGQRVTVQLDDQGRAVKAIESPAIPEVPPPTQ
jgi:hypothetical protein